MKLVKKFFCPVDHWCNPCPYWEDGGTCALVNENVNPVEECADASAFWDIDDDYFVWKDETVYDTADLLELGYHFVNGEPILPLDNSDNL